MSRRTFVAQQKKWDRGGYDDPFDWCIILYRWAYSRSRDQVRPQRPPNSSGQWQGLGFFAAEGSSRRRSTGPAGRSGARSSWAVDIARRTAERHRWSLLVITYNDNIAWNLIYENTPRTDVSRESFSGHHHCAQVAAGYSPRTPIYII